MTLCFKNKEGPKECHKDNQRKHDLLKTRLKKTLDGLVERGVDTGKEGDRTTRFATACNAKLKQQEQATLI